MNAPSIERHVADSLAAADAYDRRAMQALSAGDAVGADECWATASLLRISASMIQNGMVTR